MSVLKPEVGMTSGVYRDEITRDRIAAFCQAIGIEDSQVAPPTFLTLFRRGEFDLFQKLGIELSRVLHAGQEYQYENEIQAGDCVRFETVISNLLEKDRPSARMQFITLETEVYVERSSENYRVGKAKTTVVVR